MQAAIAVDGLLLQFRHHPRLFLAEDLAQERLRVQRADIPRLQVLWPEVAKLKVKIMGASPWTAAASTWRSFSSFVIRGISAS